MLEQAFNEVYTKFKLHFYRAVFGRFQKREASLTTVAVSYTHLTLPTIRLV